MISSKVENPDDKLKNTLNLAKLPQAQNCLKKIMNLHKFCKKNYMYGLGESKKNGRPVRKENIKNRCDIIFVQWVPGI